MLNRKKLTINIGGQLFDLSSPMVMGIVNVTPDSFYSGSRSFTEEEIVTTARNILEEGADIIDVGGYSSRPGASDIPVNEEKARVVRAIKLISKEFPGAIISVDSFRSQVAADAIACGAHIINDISGGEADSGMFGLVAEMKVPYIMMHMQGNPRTMQNNPVYGDVVADILKWFSSRIVRLHSAGVKDIILDPGFGFGKTVDQNFDMLNRLSDFSVAGLPVLAGLSRKSLIWKTLGTDPDGALNGTTVLNTMALCNGADILRVHDVREAVETVRLFNKTRDIAKNIS
jgi:dihydropteroate synthase